MGKRHTPEQIVRKLRAAELDLAGGATAGQVCQKLGVREQTFARWRQQYGDGKADLALRVKELEAQNARLKRLVADLSLDEQMLEEVARGKF
jgi:transposase-like protein